MISGSLVVEYFVITRPSAIASRDGRVGDCSAELRRAGGIFNCLHISSSGCQFDRGLGTGEGSLGGPRRQRVGRSACQTQGFERCVGRQGRNCLYMQASDGRPAAGMKKECGEYQVRTG